MLHSTMPAIIDHPGLRSPYPIFRRRFLVEKPSSSIARCLFGIPDPKASFVQYHHVAEKSQTDFKKQWNFDPHLNLPVGVDDEGEMEIDYNWTELDDEGQDKPNQVTVAQEEIYSTAAPTSIPEVLVESVPALSTLAENSKVSEMEPVKIENVKIEIEESQTPTALSPIGIFSPPNVDMESGSDEEGLSPVIGATSCGSCTATAVLEVVAHTPTSRRLVSGSSGPILRQRCITDYMKVKKASRTVKKVLR